MLASRPAETKGAHLSEGYTATIRRGELWIDENDLLYVVDADGERTYLDAFLAEEMRAEKSPGGDKFLGVGKVYVFVGTDDWEQFRDQVQEASRLLAEGETDLAQDTLRNALEVSEGLA